MSLDPDTQTLIGAILGAIALIGSAIIAKLPNKFFKNHRKTPHVKTIAILLSKSKELFDGITQLHKETELDRFYIFVANKKTRHTSSYLEFRSGKQTYREYQDVIYDLDYENKLNTIEKESHLLVNTSAEQECLIKDIYEDENINFAIWTKIYSDETYICYCSHATHKEQLSSNTVTRHSLLINRFVSFSEHVNKLED